MSYITTNIRIPEEDYLTLKAEATKRRKSLSEVIREKLRSQKKRTPTEVESILRVTKTLAKDNSKYLKGWNSLEALGEIRNNS